jgi:hypothetical protein
MFKYLPSLSLSFPPLLEERLELDVGELDVKKVEEEACLFKEDLPEDGTLLQASL